MSIIQRMDPKAAHQALTQTPGSVLIDVRDPIESKFVGYPKGAHNIPWKFAPDMRLNDRFLAEVKAVASAETPIYLLCRSGQRSMQAAELLEAEGFKRLVNIEEGFEGDLDQNKHRSNTGGWRFYGLPWEQS